MSSIQLAESTEPDLPPPALPLVYLHPPNPAYARPPSVILTALKKLTKQEQSELGRQGRMQALPLASSLSYVHMLQPEDKFVLAPMPQVLAGGRLPLTVTTSSHRPKLALLPPEPPPLPPPPPPPPADNEYELSIVEDADGARRPKHQKHGISILKKHTNEKARTCLPQAIAQPAVDAGKNSRSRRKSSFAYRKDYDDLEVVVEESVGTKMHDINMNDDDMARNLRTERCKENEEDDFEKLLKWERGVGSLPGSTIQFVINEFGMLEYLTPKIAEQKTSIRLEDDIRCKNCGCFGQPSEFVTSKFCSLDCQISVLLPKQKRKNKSKKLIQSQGADFSVRALQSEPPSPCPNNKTSESDDQTQSNENSQDKFVYPWYCSKRGFSWAKYLEHLKAKSAPVKLFKDPFPYAKNGFRPGMKLEGIDPQHPSYFCVLSVVEVVGYRLRLAFDGYSDLYEFWANADSPDIFPSGWCERHGRALRPPGGAAAADFGWAAYLREARATAAPKQLFAARAVGNVCPNGFRVGMKLEAVDRTNLNLVCVASVKDMLENRILVHFDSWDDIYDYWVDPTSAYIHPVGWCDQTGHDLTPPNDYPNPSSFSWETYLKETKSVAAPVRAFKQRPPNPFKIGMRLECVDKRMPQFVRVAHVSDVRGHQIRVHFDGWRDIYSYWIDDDSADIHPSGWCQKTGHPLEAPLTPADVYDAEHCPTAGCHGQGHANGRKALRHARREDCPYAEENLVERTLPDRLLSPERVVEAVVPVSREAKEKIKPKMGRPLKAIKQEAAAPVSAAPPITPPAPKEEVKDEPPESFEVKKPKRKYRKKTKFLSAETIDEPEEEEEDEEEEEEEPKVKIRKRAHDLIENSKLEPAVKESWPKHSQYLNNYLRGIDSPLEWDELRVASFVGTLPGCAEYARKFRTCEIDGVAFLSLSQRDLINILRIKVGHAVKLYNVIVLLRRKFREQFERFS